jgi:hypothetical protein
MNMKKNFTFAFLVFPSLLASFFGSHPVGFVVPTSRMSSASAPITSVGTDTSLNWAGYVATSGAFTSVGANWAVPTATGTNSNLSADATWVGIGGISSADLIQAGTQTVIQGGVPSYQAWYELLPAASVQVPLTVHPGDAMTISIAEQASSTWEISFGDASTGQSYQASVPYSSSLSSAEWIEEMPSDARNFVALDNFGTVSFTGAFAVQNGTQMTPSALGAQPMTMITSAGQALASPSSLGPDGASFTVTRSAAVASTVPATTITTGRGGRWSRTGQGAEGYTPRPRLQAQPGAADRGNRFGHFSFDFGGFASFFGNFRNSERFTRVR